MLQYAFSWHLADKALIIFQGHRYKKMQTKAIFSLDASQEGNPHKLEGNEESSCIKKNCLQRSRTGENPLDNVLQSSIVSINYPILCALLARLEPFRYLIPLS